MRMTISIILEIILICITFWLGEGGISFLNPVPVFITLQGCVAATIFFPGSYLKKVLIGIGSLIIIAGSFALGTYSFNSAFNECIHKGENVRLQLKEYYFQNKHYPENLNQLSGILPGKRLIRPTILKYKRTQGGYELTFQDWLVEFKANQLEPFIAHK